MRSQPDNPYQPAAPTFEDAPAAEPTTRSTLEIGPRRPYTSGWVLRTMLLGSPGMAFWIVVSVAPSIQLTGGISLIALGV